ncbi:MAG: NAD-dependent epimerase/dehydratase family protein [Chloroflexi bacterium]|nr:NAD-dependent epimerase/dehydratase family protein [Chloroflexota bacterium]
MNLLIIGGTGFFGPTVVQRALDAHHDVLVYHRATHDRERDPDVPHLHGSTLEVGQHIAAIKDFAPDAVIDTSQFMAETTEAVIDTIVGLCERYILVSSADVYRAFGVVHGTEPGPLQAMPVNEDAELRTKKSFDSVATEFEDNLYAERAALGQNRVPATIVRAPAMFGAGDTHGRISFPMKRLQESGGMLVLPEEAAGFRHTHGYVDNVADALLLCAADRRDGNFVYNAGYPNGLSVMERFTLVAEAMGWDGEITSSPDLKSQDTINFNQELIMDTTRIRNNLGYKETVGLKDAIRSAVAWELQQCQRK